MDNLSKILQVETSSTDAQVLKNTEEQQKNFELEVGALIDLYHFIEQHPDEVTKKIMKFMPPVNAKVMAEATKRLRKQLDINK